MSREHLGDLVYVEQENEAVVLITQNGVDTEGNPIIGNCIYLEPDVLCSLQRWLLKRKVTSLPA